MIGLLLSISRNRATNLSPSAGSTPIVTQIIPQWCSSDAVFERGAGVIQPHSFRSGTGGEVVLYLQTPCLPLTDSKFTGFIRITTGEGGVSANLEVPDTSGSFTDARPITEAGTTAAS